MKKDYMFICHAKTRDFDDILSLYSLKIASNNGRGDLSRAGIIFFTRSLTAGIIRMRVLFEGGSYLKKYGIC